MAIQHIAASREINRHGMRAIIVAQMLFSMSDTLVKLSAPLMPSGELIAIRGTLGTAILFLLARREGGSLKGALHPVVLLRAVLEGVTTLLFLVAINGLPIGNYTAIMLSSPLMITALAVVALGHQVGWHRWLAIAVGFVGVLLVAQPSASGFSSAAWFAIACAMLVAVRDIVTRFVPSTMPSMVVTLMTSLVTALMGGGMAGIQGIIRPSPYAMLLLVLAALAISGANLGLIMGSRKADIGAIAPLRYIGMPMALVSGWLIWNNIPNVEAMIGITFIIGSGLYALHRERLRA
ncbi:MAG: DMT family transporter [Hyphomicrobiales bacterium]|nr:DMT family transporter [Hyphomicrobiales bacterium]